MSKYSEFLGEDFSKNVQDQYSKITASDTVRPQERQESEPADSRPRIPVLSDMSDAFGDSVKWGIDQFFGVSGGLGSGVGNVLLGKDFGEGFESGFERGSSSLEREIDIAGLKFTPETVFDVGNVAVNPVAAFNEITRSGASIASRPKESLQALLSAPANLATGATFSLSGLLTGKDVGQEFLRGYSESNNALKRVTGGILGEDDQYGFLNLSLDTIGILGNASVAGKFARSGSLLNRVGTASDEVINTFARATGKTVDIATRPIAGLASGLMDGVFGKLASNSLKQSLGITDSFLSGVGRGVSKGFFSGEGLLSRGAAKVGTEILDRTGLSQSSFIQKNLLGIRSADEVAESMMYASATNNKLFTNRANLVVDDLVTKGVSKAEINQALTNSLKSAMEEFPFIVGLTGIGYASPELGSAIGNLFISKNLASLGAASLDAISVAGLRGLGQVASQYSIDQLDLRNVLDQTLEAAVDFENSLNNPAQLFQNMLMFGSVRERYNISPRTEASSPDTTTAPDNTVLTPEDLTQKVYNPMDQAIPVEFYQDVRSLKQSIIENPQILDSLRIDPTDTLSKIDLSKVAYTLSGGAISSNGMKSESPIINAMADSPGFKMLLETLSKNNTQVQGVADFLYKTDLPISMENMHGTQRVYELVQASKPELNTIEINDFAYNIMDPSSIDFTNPFSVANLKLNFNARINEKVAKNNGNELTSDSKTLLAIEETLIELGIERPSAGQIKASQDIYNAVEKFDIANTVNVGAIKTGNESLYDKLAKMTDKVDSLMQELKLPTFGLNLNEKIVSMSLKYKTLETKCG